MSDGMTNEQWVRERWPNAIRSAAELRKAAGLLVCEECGAQPNKPCVSDSGDYILPHAARMISADAASRLCGRLGNPHVFGQVMPCVLAKNHAGRHSALAGRDDSCALLWHESDPMGMTIEVPASEPADELSGNPGELEPVADAQARDKASRAAFETWRKQDDFGLVAPMGAHSALGRAFEAGQAWERCNRDAQIAKLTSDLQAMTVDKEFAKSLLNEARDLLEGVQCGRISENAAMRWNYKHEKYYGVLATESIAPTAANAPRNATETANVTDGDPTDDR